MLCSVFINACISVTSLTNVYVYAKYLNIEQR